MLLVKPTPLYQSSFLQAEADIRAEQNKRFLSPPIQGNFEDYCNQLISQAQGLNLPPGYVPVSTFWLIDKEQFIGRLSIRHQLSPALLKIGGHIGYIIAPRDRELGYGTAILKLGLAEAARLGIPRVLVTCRVSNTASAKIIERNGGILENEVFDDDSLEWQKRYWITLA